MRFIVWSNDEPFPFQGDARYLLEDDGVLQVMDPDSDRLITFSPSGWSRMEKALPDELRHGLSDG